MHVMDLETTPARMLISPNILTVVPVYAEAEFPKHPVPQLHVAFYFLGGLYLLNPMMYLTMILVWTGIRRWKLGPSNGYLAANDATLKSVPPPAEEGKEDGYY
jgi:hypothetical protein